MKKLGLAILLIFFLIAISILRPVPIVEEKDAIVEKGIVIGIYEAGVKDVVFILKDNSRRYYINRGLENGLNLNKLRKKLINKEIVIKYPKYWTPLDWNNNVRHLSKVEFGQEVIFNELK